MEAEVKLRGVRALLRDSWQIYKARWKVLLGVSVIPYLVAVVFGFLIVFPEISPFLKIIYIVVFGVFIVLLFAIAQLAIVKAIAENTSIGESYSQGKARLWPFYKTMILSSLLTIGGYFFFVIPGILLSIWFAFSIYFVALEGKSGFEALIMSKKLLKSKILAVFFRSLFLIIVIILISVVAGIITDTVGSKSLQDIIEAVLNLLFTPLASIYTYLIYSDLKKIKPAESLSVEPGDKKRLVIFPILGYVVFIVFVIFGISMLTKLDFNGTPDYGQPVIRDTLDYETRVN